MKKWLQRWWTSIAFVLAGVAVGRLAGLEYARQKARDAVEAEHQHFAPCAHPELGNGLVDVRQCVGGIQHVYACGGWDLEPMTPEEAAAELRPKSLEEIQAELRALHSLLDGAK